MQLGAGERRLDSDGLTTGSVKGTDILAVIPDAAARADGLARLPAREATGTRTSRNPWKGPAS